MTVNTRRIRKGIPALLGAVALLGALAPVYSATHTARAATPHYLTIVDRFAPVWVRNFNPFLKNSVGSEWSTGAIYEPLIVFATNPAHNVYPMLATDYKWTDGNKTLLINLRHGVQWSDGQPFTAKDVVFTYNFGKTCAGCDQISLASPSGNVASVAQMSDYQVAVHLKTVDTTILPTLLSNIFILPEHIWSTVKDPLTWTNPTPVGTGPFTEIQNFTAQSYIMARNPHYWQPGKPIIDGLRVPLFTANDSAGLALIKGETDWTNNFQANAQASYVSHDPKHFHYFYATNGAPNGLWFNDTVYPFSLAGFRKALSYAINRQQIYTVAEYTYEPPSDAAGLSAAWPSWADPTLTKQAQEQATFNPTKAAAMLKSLGFTMKNQQLYDPKGKLVTITLNVINGWNDWVLQMQIIQQQLANLGIDTSVHLMTGPAWFDQTNKGQVSAWLHWVSMPAATSPYYYYNAFMSKETYVPTGQDASTRGNNLERWSSSQVTDLLHQYKQTTDTAKQKAIIAQIEKIQLDQMPFIPLNYGANWDIYSTLHFTGYSTPDNFYANPAPSNYPDSEIVMLRLKPAQ